MKAFQYGGEKLTWGPSCIILMPCISCTTYMLPLSHDVLFSASDGYGTLAVGQALSSRYAFWLDIFRLLETDFLQRHLK